MSCPVIIGEDVICVVEGVGNDSVVVGEFVVVNGVDTLLSGVETISVISIEVCLVLVDPMFSLVISVEDISKVDCDKLDVDNLLLVGLVC